MRVSAIGVGTAEIGYGVRLDESGRAAAVLNTALDAGINLIDTAACYGIAEELIGATIAHRRSEYYISTKCGHVAAGYSGEPWSYETVTDSIERSLRRMKTDVIDIVHLHSCSVDVLERGEALEALQRARQAGKVRHIGYSGDNEAATWAIRSGLFPVLQTSFNIVDQRARRLLFPRARAAGMGVIAKRPIANGAWDTAQSPAPYADSYFYRANVMLAEGPLFNGADGKLRPIETVLGYTLSFPEVSTAIVGTLDPVHVSENVAALESAISISPVAVASINRRFDEVGEMWEQLT